MTKVPRAIGRARLAVKAVPNGGSGIAHLQTSGCAKLLFPRSTARVDTILINTAGGLTGGDQLTCDFDVQQDAHLAVTTQAAERGYRTVSGAARVETTLNVAPGGTLFWLPQELILFDGAALNRRLTCDLAPGARFLFVEPIVFGRHYMGEQVKHLSFTDAVRITRAGQPLYNDALRFDGNTVAHLARPACTASAGAMASLVYVGPDAEARGNAIRPHLPTTGGASLKQPDLFIARLVASEAMTLRAALLPILDILTDHTLPTSWRL